MSSCHSKKNFCHSKNQISEKKKGHFREDINTYYKLIKKETQFIFNNIKDFNIIKSKFEEISNPIAQLEYLKFLISRKESVDDFKFNDSGFEKILSNEFLSHITKLKIEFLYKTYKSKENAGKIKDLTPITDSEKEFVKKIFDHFKKNRTIDEFLEIKNLFEYLKREFMFYFLDLLWSLYFENSTRIFNNDHPIHMKMDFEIFTIMNQPTRVNLIVWSSVIDISKNQKGSELFLMELDFFIKYNIKVDAFLTQWRISLKMMIGKLGYDSNCDDILYKLSQLNVKFAIEMSQERV